MRNYLMRECVDPDCRFRFPAAVDDPRGEVCPKCQAAKTTITDFPLPTAAPFSDRLANPLHLELLLDNIRSVYNVGALFRTADGAGVRHLHLSGITPTPAHPQLGKTALGAEQTVPWRAYNNGVDAVRELKAAGYAIWGLEADARAVDLLGGGGATAVSKAVLIVGNEKTGVDPALLDHCDQIFALPMRGQKNSLNVTIAAGIAVYHLLFA